MFPSSSAPSREYIKRDSQIWWRPGRLYIPAGGFDMRPAVRGTGAAVAADMQFNATGGPLPDANEVVVADAAAIYGLPMYSQGTGNPEYGRINVAGGPHAWLMSTAGDDIRKWAEWPSDVDVSKNIYFRVHWTSAAAAVGARDITFLVLYSSLAEDGTIVAPATALDSTIAADVPTGTAHQWQMSAYGRINANTILDTALSLGLIVEMDAFNAAFTENKYILGLEVRYTPKRLYYDGMLHEAKDPLKLLSNKYS